MNLTCILVDNGKLLDYMVTQIYDGRFHMQVLDYLTECSALYKRRTHDVNIYLLTESDAYPDYRALTDKDRNICVFLDRCNSLDDFIFSLIHELIHSVYVGLSEDNVKFQSTSLKMRPRKKTKS